MPWIEINLLVFLFTFTVHRVQGTSESFEFIFPSPNCWIGNQTLFAICKEVMNAKGWHNIEFDFFELNWMPFFSYLRRTRSIGLNLIRKTWVGYTPTNSTFNRILARISYTYAQSLQMHRFIWRGNIFFWIQVPPWSDSTAYWTITYVISVGVHVPRLHRSIIRSMTYFSSGRLKRKFMERFVKRNDVSVTNPTRITKIHSQFLRRSLYRNGVSVVCR